MNQLHIVILSVKLKHYVLYTKESIRALQKYKIEIHNIQGYWETTFTFQIKFYLFILFFLHSNVTNLQSLGRYISVYNLRLRHDKKCFGM